MTEFWLDYGLGLGADSATNRNEYQGYLLEVMAASV